MTVVPSSRVSSMPSAWGATRRRTAFEDGHTFVGQDVGEDGGHIRILPAGHAAAGHDGDLGAETGEHLPELEPDITAADHDQALGQLGEGQQLDLGQDVDLVDSRQRGDGGPSPDVQVDLGRGELLVVHDHPVLPAVRVGGQGRLAIDEIEVVSVLGPVGHRLLLLTDDAVHAGHRRPEVDRHLAGVDPVLRSPPGLVGDHRARSQRLGRFAAVVEAGPADPFHLDHGDLATFAGQVSGHAGPRLTGSDHYRVVGNHRR